MDSEKHNLPDSKAAFSHLGDLMDKLDKGEIDGKTANKYSKLVGKITKLETKLLTEQTPEKMAKLKELKQKLKLLMDL